MNQTVEVAGRTVVVVVEQTAKNLWTVHGVCSGSWVSVSSAGRRTAINRWRRAAAEHA